MSFLDRSIRSNDRLSYWGGPMAGRFEAWQRLVAMAAAERWGMRDPCPADVLEDVLGARWMEMYPGLASLVTSYAIGAED